LAPFSPPPGHFDEALSDDLLPEHGLVQWFADYLFIQSAQFVDGELRRQQIGRKRRVGRFVAQPLDGLLRDDVMIESQVRQVGNRIEIPMQTLG